MPAADGTAYGRAALADECDTVRSAVNGTLHYTLASSATSIGRLVPHCLPFEEAEIALYQATAAAGGVDMAGALRTIRGQLEFGMTDPKFPPERESISGVDLSGFGQQEEEPAEEEAFQISDPGPFPEHLLDVPGLVNDVAALTNRNSFVFQPILAMAGALALMATITGRKIRDKDGARTNVYILSVAGSGEGKDAARKTNKKILFAAGAGIQVGAESWASGPGLLAAVEKQPAILFQNDEIGRFLQTTNDPAKAPHLHSIISVLLKLYSSADDVFLGDAYADGRQSNIVQPHAVVYGTTVPGSLYAALTEDSITGGLMGRMFVFESPETQQPVKDPDTIDQPEEITALVRQWFRWQPSAGNLASENPVPFVVPTDPEADDIFRELRTISRDQRAIVGDVLGSLWVRAVENARKLALLYSCSAAFGTAVRVNVGAAKWACALTSYLIRRQCWAVHRFFSRNKVESSNMEVQRLIDKSGADGITGTKLMRATRNLTKRERDDILTCLIECGYVQAMVSKSSGRPTRIYRSIRS